MTAVPAGDAKLPLAGIKVAELSNNIAGPYAGYILAMLGADVLKIERPGSGDDARGWGPPFWRGTSATFHALNVNKRGVTIDLKDAAQIAWLQGYVKDCDVLLHNLRPGVMEDLGLGSDGPDGSQPTSRLLQSLGVRPQRADAAPSRLRADGAGLRGAVLDQRLSRPAGRAHRHLGAGPGQCRVGGARLHHCALSARPHRQGMRG